MFVFRPSHEGTAANATTPPLRHCEIEDKNTTISVQMTTTTDSRYQNLTTSCIRNAIFTGMRVLVLDFAVCGLNVRNSSTAVPMVLCDSVCTHDTNLVVVSAVLLPGELVLPSHGTANLGAMSSTEIGPGTHMLCYRLY
eukprot:3941505-Rhodomonas_salina.2